MTDAVEVLRIDSLEDERLDAYVRLTERELRCVLEPQKGIFIAESAKVIERAVRAGYEPVSFLLGERWLDQMMPLLTSLSCARERVRFPCSWPPWSSWSS